MKTHGQLAVKPNFLLMLCLFCISSLSFSQVTVNTLTELLPYLKQDNVEVTLAPGTYTVTAEDIQNGLFPDYTDFLDRKNYVLFLVSGNNSVYDFTDVTINVETAVFNAYTDDYDNFYEFQTTGNNNVLKNLTLVDLGSVDDFPKNGACNITMDGSYNRIEGFHITAKGSFPYGYGDSFGKGSTYTISHKKHSAFLIRGESNHAKGVTIIHRTYGHCMFMQAANNALIEDCYLEGEMRSTDDMLAEEGTGSPADLIDFYTVWGYKLPPGYMKSTGEAGIRAYNAGETIIDGVEYSRGTSNVTVKNCTIKHLRTGVTLAHATGTKYVEGTTAIGCENGFSLGTGTVVDSYADCAYGPVYSTTYTTDKNFDAEITVIPAEDPYYNGSGNVAYIGGSNHNITLKSAPGLVINQDLKIKFGGERNHISSLGDALANQDNFTANNIVIDNQTNFAINLSEDASYITGQSGGMVTDLGTNNNIVHTAVSVSKIEAEDYTNMEGVTVQTTTDETGTDQVTNITSGNWLEYDVDVQLSGTYTMGYRIASANTGEFTLSSAEDTLEYINFSATGDNETWNTVHSETPFYLESGTHTLRITSQSADWNFNWLDLALECAVVTIDPFVEELNALGISLNLLESTDLNVFPGNTARLQPEPELGGSWSWTGPNNFISNQRVVMLENIQTTDAGEYNVTYTNDCGQTSTATFNISVQGNITIEGEAYSTMSGVETETTTDISGTDQVSAIDANDWMEYTLNIEKSATYAFSYRIASASEAIDFNVQLDNQDLEQVMLPATGSASTWTTASAHTTYLTAGTHTLRLTSNSSGWLLNWMQLQGIDFVNPCELPFNPDVFNVQNEEKQWTSGLIDISCVTSVNTYISFSGTETLTAADYLNMYYKLDGGERIAISENTGIPSEASGVVTNLSGETLELIIEGKSISTENVYTISKINIVESTDPFVRIEAEDFTDSDGPRIGTTGDEGGGQNLGSIKPGHWSMYAGLDLTNVTSINARVASTYDDAKVEVRINASDGMLIGIIDVPNTGAWQTYETASAYIEDVTGIYDVYLVYTTTESANVCNINWFEFSDAFVRAPINPFSMFEAEYYDAENGTQTVSTTDNTGIDQVGDIQNGDWLMYKSLDITDAYSLDLRVASANDNTAIELRLDAPDGLLFSYINVPNTGANNSWNTISATLKEVTGEHDIYVIFKGDGDDLVNINWLQFKLYENSFERLEAEDYDNQQGDPSIKTTSDVDGEEDLRSIVPGDWVMFSDIDLTDAKSVSARIGSVYDDAFIEVRTDAADGDLIGIINLYNTGGWYNWETVTGNITNVTGSHDVYFIFNTETSKNVCNINWFHFSGLETTEPFEPFVRIEAEDYSIASNTIISATTDVDGEEEVSNLQNENWLMYSNLDINAAASISLRLASISDGNSIEVRIDDYNGTLISTIAVPNTESLTTWTTVSENITTIEGTHDIYLVFKGESENIGNINWLKFNEGTVLSVSDEDYQKVFMYPNPVSDVLNIKNGIGAQIDIYDITGKQILTKQITTNNQVINLSHFSNGLYLVKIENEGKVTVKKIMKQ